MPDIEDRLNEMIKRLSDAEIDTVDAKSERLRVVIQEVTDGDCFVDGVPIHMPNEN